MGLLRESEYWSARANELFAQRSRPGIPMSVRDAEKILNIACKAFTDLIHDPEFENDIQLAIEVGIKARESVESAGDFRRFVEEFKRAEHEILLKSGVDDLAAAELLSEIEDLGDIIRDPRKNFEFLPQKLEFCQKLACKNAGDVETNRQNNEIRTSRVKDTKKALTGTVIIAVDIGVSAATLPALYAGVSVGVGVAFVHDALKNRF